jgi:phospholipid/cholesterol/gamma-HCH transport system substrate-binding protein
MAVAAMTVLVVMILLLTTREPLFASYETIYTYMRDSAALGQGAPVRLNGILIGSIRTIELSGDPDPARTVKVTMEVRRRMLPMVPVDSVAEVSAENVLGAKYINVQRGTAVEHIQPGGTLPGEPSAEIADLVKRGFGLFDATQAILGRIDRLIESVEKGQGSVGRFLRDEEFHDRLVATIKEFQQLAHELNSGQGTVGKLLKDDTLYNDVRSTTARLDAILLELQQGQGTAGKFLKDPSLYNEARASIAELRRMIDELNAGRGTAGKLLKDEAVYRQVQGILTRLDSTLDRVNSGQGTIGQLLSNQQLYENLTGVGADARQLIKDIRANPKKFLTIKLEIF